MTQVTRVIRINTSNTSKRIALDSAATTWGELKAEMMAHPVAKLALDGNVKAVVRETRVTLEDDSAQLPSFDCQLFMTVKKSKGGARANDKYTSMNESQLAKECKKKGVTPGSSMGNTRVKLRKFDLKNGSVSTTTKKPVAKKVVAKKPVVKEAVCVDPEVKAKMEKKAAKAAKKAAKKAKKAAKAAKSKAVEAPVPAAPIYDVNADLNAISKATEAVSSLEDNQEPSKVIEALGELSSTSETTSAVSNLVTVAVEKVRTYEFADKEEVSALIKGK